jgi:hypothetical protein
MMAGEVQLRAGPLVVAFVDGDLRRLRLNGREVLSRIYMALRDTAWNTIPGEIEDLSVRQDHDGFVVTYDSTHRCGEIDFRWRATIVGGEPGNLSFRMEGKAHSDFLRNRIGLCVHHPMRECAGKPCHLVDSTGRRWQSEFPARIAPHQPFLDVRSITHEIEPGVSVEVSFEGDVFETEDHRNWTDAGFKTYSTPLALPFPVLVKSGDSVKQRVNVRLHGVAARPAAETPRGVRVSWPAGPAMAMPRLGLALPACGGSPSDAEMESLTRLRLSHLRVEAADTQRVDSAARVAAQMGAKLEIALTLPGDASALRGFVGSAARWLISQRNEPAAGRATLEAARSALPDAAVLVAGSDANFAELNRNRPSEEWCEAASFALNPQVHVTDDEAVMENAAAQGEAVRSAQEFFGGAVVVSPVTLRARGTADPRQRQPFCAAWTVASLKSLAEAGASSITYFETHGAAGVVDGDELFPVYSVLLALADFSSGQVVPSLASDWRRVTSLLVADGPRRLLLVANLTDEPVQVEAPREIVLAPHAVESMEWNEG